MLRATDMKALSWTTMLLEGENNDDENELAGI